MTGRPTGRYSFHTILEDLPWRTVILGKERMIERDLTIHRMDDPSSARRASLPRDRRVCGPPNLAHCIAEGG